MTDLQKTLSRYRLPLDRDHLKQLGSLKQLKQLRTAMPRRNDLRGPLFFGVGAAVLGVAGFFAWKHREQIAEKAKPVIDDAKAKLDVAAAKGRSFLDDASAKAKSLTAKAQEKAQEAGEKATAAVRRDATPQMPPPEVH